jgi:hypothetical protein
MRPSPRSPRGPDEPAIEPAPSPPGLGRVVGSLIEGKRQRRRGFVAVLLTIVLIWMVWALLHRSFQPLPLWLGTLVGTWLLMVWVDRPQSVAVGADWLWLRSGRHDRWVKTDELAKVEFWGSWARRKLILRDRAGRRVTVDVGFLEEKPALYAAFVDAVRRSQAAGLRLGLAAAGTLGLDRGPPR